MLPDAKIAFKDSFKNLESINSNQIQLVKKEVEFSINYAIAKGEFKVECSWDSDISRVILKWLSDSLYKPEFKHVRMESNGHHKSTFKISWGEQ